MGLIINLIIIKTIIMVTFITIIIVVTTTISITYIVITILKIIIVVIMIFIAIIIFIRGQRRLDAGWWMVDGGWYPSLRLHCQWTLAQPSTSTGCNIQ